jgi:IS5 family transposase
LSGKIICVNESKGAVHDFKLFQQNKVHLLKNLLLIADKGYQGIEQMHAFTLIPFKKPRKRNLSPKQRKWNRMISKVRIFIEPVNRWMKRFKIFKYRYRNKQRKHFLRFSLICGLFNYDLGF